MTRRDPSLEIFRGIAICEVVVHHVTGFARLHIHPATLSHLLYTAANRTLHFAVPAFLFLMAVLLTRTMVGRGRTWKEFYTRRVQQTLIPYLIWSVLYAVFATWHGKIDPAALKSWGDWGHWLVWGKAWFHLYFLVLALQLYVVFPLVMLALQRARASLPCVLLFCALAQLALYWAHLHWIRSPYPSTLLIWHVAPVVTGIWIGLNLEDWEGVWRRLRIPALAMAMVGWAAYLPQGLRELRGQPINSLEYQVAFWVYTLGVSLCLLALCRALADRGGLLARGLQVLGVRSMQIYLLHPMLLYFWYAAPQTGSTLRIHLTVLMVSTGAVAVCLLVARLAGRTPLGRIIFGRADTPLARLSARG